MTLVGMIMIALASPIFVAWAVDTYDFTMSFKIADTSGVARTNVPVRLGVKGTNLTAQGLIDADGLDSRMKDGSTSLKYMITDNDIIIVVPTLAAYQTRTIVLFFNYSPDQASLNIVGGEGYTLTVADAAPLELGNNFEVEISANFDTSLVGENVMNKPSGITMGVTSSGELTASFFAGGGNYTELSFSTTPKGLYSGSRIKYGQRILNFASTITSVQLRLKKQGSPTGLAYCRVWNSSTGDVIGTLGSIDVSTLTTSDAYYYFTTTPVTIATSTTIYVGLEYTGGNSSNLVYIESTGSGALADTAFTYTSSWSNDGNDLVCVITYQSVFDVVAAGVTSGEHIVKISADGTNFKIYIDAIEKDSHALSGASVPNSANDWGFGGDLMSSINYIKITVGGSLVAWYEPNTIIISTTIPDRQGADQNATISFGANSDLTVVPLGVVPGSAVVSTAGADDATAAMIRDGIEPTDFIATGAIPGALPFWDVFDAAATSSGIPVDTLYTYAFFGVSMAGGLMAMILTGQLVIAVVFTGFLLVVGVGAHVLSVYMVIIYAVVAGSIMYMGRR